MWGLVQLTPFEIVISFLTSCTDDQKMILEKSNSVVLRKTVYYQFRAWKGDISKKNIINPKPQK